ncbi:Ypk2p [Rhizophagus irregularis DAOM 197198w]|uniref:Ypk2p n=3 Tax=Rhizophagus irregularis TaxID=588596 RepID=A0A015JJ69_RHIIW|nr:Ypk2p [Rhizophagus irregularis DAOM 197198w]
MYCIKKLIKSSNTDEELNDICENCKRVCYGINFQRNFKNWTSGNNYIDIFIQVTQLSVHYQCEISNALEWIPYDKFYNIKYILEDTFGKEYKANWIDGYIYKWNNYFKNWKRRNKNMFVILKSLNDPKYITLNFMNEIEKKHETYGITQNPKTKNYMIVLDDKCKCNIICNAKIFQQNFKNWTSGNKDIDKFIQGTQLLAHNNVENTLEWIPYDRFYDINYIAEDNIYKANWIDGCIDEWDIENHNWKRYNQNMFVNLKSLDNSKNITSELINKANQTNHRLYGITQDPESKNYMMVLNDECKKCYHACNATIFQNNFKNWTSGNNDIDKLIQDTQLSAHKNAGNALEWIPYDKFHNIKHIAKDEFGEIYEANWIDGLIDKWDDENQNWKRYNQNMFVNLKGLNTPENLTLEFINKIKRDHELYGMTQDPKKNYMIVLNNKCAKCNYICNSIYFQRNFKSWTSGNNDIDKLIQDAQLSTHENAGNALEWIPYDRFYNIKYILEDSFGKEYKANWIDGYVYKWNNNFRNWRRRNKNMFVTLKSLNNPKNVKSVIMNEIHSSYGITQDPQTKNYMMVLSDKCKKCNKICNTIYFQRNFKSWTSGNNDIDKIIQDAQLSAHKNARNVLEWIPYDKFYNIKYIAKGGFGKVYKANWIDGRIWDWNDKNQNWERYGKNMVVALKSLNNSKNVTFEFMNEITSHHKVSNDIIIGFYGITQDPETKDYMMVLEYAINGSLRNYLDTNYNKLSWERKIRDLCDVAKGLESIHNNNLIHRDLHIGNILMGNDTVYITDMGLCKPADYNESENAKNNTYGVLPYIAPEILRGENYTEASDIYSFGIIMYEVISGLPPYHDLNHDQYLAIKICQGLRPRFNIKVPQFIVDLVKSCLDANPLNRPTAKEIYEIFNPWSLSTELRKQISKTVEINNNSSNNKIPSTNLGLSYKTHSETFYASRLLNFDNLPEPKNSDDYYERNDNIIGMEISGIN